MKKTIVSIASTLALLSMGTQAQPVEFKNIFSLGDSLSDVGTYSNAMIMSGAPPQLQYRFTNNNPDGSSKVWVEHLAQQLNLDLRPNQINPNNIGGVLLPRAGPGSAIPLGLAMHRKTSSPRCH